MLKNDICFGIRPVGDKHSQMDLFGKANRMTVVFAPWHPNPEYRIFETGSLLSRNDEYPSGLVIVEKNGKPYPWIQI